jgi:hypothetical protein
MKASRRLAENDIITRGVTVKIQQVAVCKNILFGKSIIKAIFASQGLRSTLLIFTIGIVRRIFVILAHCHLLDFDSNAPCNEGGGGGI